MRRQRIELVGEARVVLVNGGTGVSGRDTTYDTLAALLANNFPEAGAKQVGVLMYAALVLLATGLVTGGPDGPRARRPSLTSVS